MLNKKTLLILFSSFTVLLFFILVLLLLLPSKLKLVNTDPANKAQQVSLKPELTFIFNKKVNQEEFSYEINPSVELDPTYNDKTIVYKPRTELNYKTNYSLIITNSKYNKEYSLTFDTKDENELVGNEVSEHIDAVQKLTGAGYLPLIKKEYNIDYWEKENSFIVTMKWPPCDEAKQSVAKWFSDQGFDYTKLKIVWTAEKGLPDDCYFE